MDYTVYGEGKEFSSLQKALAHARECIRAGYQSVDIYRDGIIFRSGVNRHKKIRWTHKEG